MREDIAHYGKQLLNLIESEGEKSAKAHHAELQNQNPKLRHFGYYIEYYRTYEAYERIVKMNVERTGLPEEIIRSADTLAFERAIGIPPLSYSIPIPLEILLLLQKEKV